MKLDTNYIRPSLLADIIIDLEDDPPNGPILAKLKALLIHDQGKKGTKQMLCAAWEREFSKTTRGPGNPYK